MAGVVAGDFRSTDEEISTTTSVLEYFHPMKNQYNNNNNNNNNSCSEIEEVVNNPSDQEELFEINWNNYGEPLASIKEEIEGSLFSFDIQNGEDNVYVAVGKSESSSMDALAWTLQHAVNNRSTFVYLIHVFPELHYIPTPLGNLQKSRVSPQQVKNYMAQERGKRRDFLQKFLDMGSASKVKMETMLIESDMVAKSILDLIPILNIRRLVLGTNKSSLRKLRSRRGNNGIAGHILHNAPEYCDVTIVCEGNEVSVEQINGLFSPRESDYTSNSTREAGEQYKDSFSCACFKPKFI